MLTLMLQAGMDMHKRYSVVFVVDERVKVLVSVKNLLSEEAASPPPPMLRR